MTLPETITIWLLDHRDGTGARITGETWDTSSCRDPNGDAFTPTITEPYSDGIYKATWSADTAGDWLFDVQGQTDPDSDDYNWSTVVTVEDTPEYPTNSEIAAALLAASVGGAGGTVGAALERIGTARVTVTSAVSTDGTITVTRGDAVTLPFSSADWSITEGNSIALTVAYAGTSTTYTGTRTSATAVIVSLTEDDTEALTAGRQHYTYLLRDTTDDTTLASGLMTVRNG